MRRKFVRFSPRGFRNEVFWAVCPAQEAEEIIRVAASTPGAWAEPMPAAWGRRLLRRLIAEAQRLGVSPAELGLRSADKAIRMIKSGSAF